VSLLCSSSILVVGTFQGETFTVALEKSHSSTTVFKTSIFYYPKCKHTEPGRLYVKAECIVGLSYNFCMQVYACVLCLVGLLLIVNVG
jgi:hypothetical protein